MQEVDFEGRAKDPELLKDVALAACFDSGSNTQHHLVYTGLEGAGPHLAFLGATVCFSVSPEHVVEKLAGPMEVGAGWTYSSCTRAWRVRGKRGHIGQKGNFARCETFRLLKILGTIGFPETHFGAMAEHLYCLTAS